MVILSCLHRFYYHAIQSVPLLSYNTHVSKPDDVQV